MARHHASWHTRLGRRGGGADRREQAPARGRLVASAVALVLLVGAPTFALASGRWQVQPILSGSMRPGFAVGGVVVAQHEPLRDLSVGSVIIVHPPDEPNVSIVHRVIRVVARHPDEALVQTKGDDNTSPDPFTATVHGPQVYVARFTLPFVGYPLVWAHSPNGRRVLLGLAALLLVLAATASRRELGRRRRLHAPGQRAPETRRGAS